MAPASRAREAERALLHSVRCGSFADVRNALDVVDAVPGASVDARGFADVTPLHAAAWRGDASIARLIVDAGASLVARDAESGWTPLHRAMHHGAFAVAAVLLEHGANPRAPKDDAGRSPLDVLSNALCRARAVAASEDPRDASRLGPRPPFAGRSATASASPPSPRPLDLYAWGSGVNFQLGVVHVADDHLREPRRLDDLAVALAAVDEENRPRHSSRVVGDKKGGSEDATEDSEARPSSGLSARRRPGGVASASAAKFHGVAVGADGALFSWGHGRGGRLGLDDREAYAGDRAVLRPARVPGFGPGSGRRVVHASAGKHHTLACDDRGHLFSWGANRDGQLGYELLRATGSGSGEPRQVTPRRVGGALRGVWVAGVSAANRHSAVRTRDGEVFAFGSNDHGQLGVFASASASTLEGTTGTGTTGRVLVATTGEKGSNASDPRRVEQLRPRFVTHVAAAKKHTLALTADGEVRRWGFGESAARRVDVASALTTRRRRAGAKTDGGFFSALDPLGAECVRIAAGASVSLALTRRGVVLQWASGDLRPSAATTLRRVRGFDGAVVAVAAGKTTCAAATDRGDAYEWGVGFTGERARDHRERNQDPDRNENRNENRADDRSSPSPSPPRDRDGAFGGSGSLPRGSLPTNTKVAKNGPFERTASAVRTPDGFEPRARKVEGVKGIVDVAVGEKHAFATQRVVRPAFGDGAGEKGGGRGEEASDESDESSESDRSDGSDGSDESDGSDAERLSDADASDADDWTRNVLSRATGKSSRRGASRGTSRGGRTFRVPSLKMLAQRAVAESVCDVRNALDVVTLGRALGAPALAAYAARVYADNLDVAVAAIGADALAERDEDAIAEVEAAARRGSGFGAAEDEGVSFPDASLRDAAPFRRASRTGWTAERLLERNDAEANRARHSPAPKPPERAENGGENGGRSRAGEARGREEADGGFSRADRGGLEERTTDPPRAPSGAPSPSPAAARAPSRSPASAPASRVRPPPSRPRSSRRAQEAAIARSARGGLSLFLSGALESSLGAASRGHSLGAAATEAPGGASTTNDRPPRTWRAIDPSHGSTLLEADAVAGGVDSFNDIQTTQAREEAERKRRAAAWSAVASRGTPAATSPPLPPAASAASAARAANAAGASGSVEMSLGALVRFGQSGSGRATYGGRGSLFLSQRNDERAPASSPASAWGAAGDEAEEGPLATSPSARRGSRRAAAGMREIRALERVAIGGTGVPRGRRRWRHPRASPRRFETSSPRRSAARRSGGRASLDRRRRRSGVGGDGSSRTPRPG